MSADPMDVTLRRLTGAAFEARNASGQTLVLDGPPSVGGVGAGLRPMEACLAALAGCSAVDVLMILQQQREPLADLEIRVHGERADAVPAVFTDIHLHFAASGAVDPGKLARAARLSMEKYCSVAKMLGAGGVRITHGVSRILPLEGAPPGVRVRVTDDAVVVRRALTALGHAGPEASEGASWLLAEQGAEAAAVGRLDASAAEVDVLAARGPDAAAALSAAAPLAR